MDIYFLSPQYTESTTYQIFCVLDVKKVKCNLASLMLLNWTQRKPI